MREQKCFSNDKDFVRASVTRRNDILKKKKSKKKIWETVYSSKSIDAGSLDRSSIIVTYYERFRMNDTLFLMLIDHLQL